jgi:hypothetical protein
VAGTHKGTRVVARCERPEESKTIALVPDLIKALQDVVQAAYDGEDVIQNLDELEALIERAEGLRG